MANNEKEQFLTYAQKKWDDLLSYAHDNNLNWQWQNPFINSGWLNNPMIQNDRLKGVNPHPVRYEREELENLITNPGDSESKLRSVSEYFFNTVITYFKLVNLYNDLLTYRNYVTVKAIHDKSKIKKEYNTVCNFLRQIGVKRLFKEVMQSVMIEGKACYLLRDENRDHIALQKLPADYIKIVHKVDGNFQVAFDMAYFLKAGSNPVWFGEKFVKYVEEFFSFYDERRNMLNMEKNFPKDVLAYVNGSTFYFWKFIPVDEVFVFGLFENTVNMIPIFTPTFLDVSELDSYKLLTQQLLSIPVSSILTAEIPFADNNKSGSFTNDTKISADVISLYQNMINNLLPQGTTFVAAPLEDFSLHTFDNVASKSDIVGDAVKNFNTQIGVNALLSSDDKPSLAQVKSAQAIETEFAKRIYGPIEYCLNTIIRKDFKLKNEFVIHVDGDIFRDQEEYKNIQQAITQGMTDFMPEYLSFHNSYPGEALRTAKFMNSLGYYELLRPMKNVGSYYNNNYEGTGRRWGRPRIDENEIESDNTALAIDAGTNTSDGKLTIQKDFSVTDTVDMEEQFLNSMD